MEGCVSSRTGLARYCAATAILFSVVCLLYWGIHFPCCEFSFKFVTVWPTTTLFPTRVQLPPKVLPPSQSWRSSLRSTGGYIDLTVTEFVKASGTTTSADLNFFLQVYRYRVIKEFPPSKNFWGRRCATFFVHRLPPYRLPCPAWRWGSAWCCLGYKCSLIPPLFPLAPSFLFPPFSCPARLLLPRRASPAPNHPEVLWAPPTVTTAHGHLRAFASCFTTAFGCNNLPLIRLPLRSHLPRDLLNRSTNRPRRPAASLSNKPRQHDAWLPQGPWPLPILADFCDELV